MGLFDFVKDAGASLFGGGSKEPAVARRDLDDVLADKQKAQALTEMVGKMGLGVDDLGIKFRDGLATVTGRAPSQDDREKVVLLIGNTQGVAQVDDRLVIAAAAAPEAEPQETRPQVTLYTVQGGDTLSGIAKRHYGNASKYMVIFEANKPMLEDPNKIYPGQVLRIPSIGS
jgi:nucleoid-associated protein YgaU